MKTATLIDQQWMSRAIQLAEHGRYTTRPNPCVGCVIVKNDVVVGEGWHQQAGQAHAEINALAAAGTDAQGASAYVSLEPCNHQGKTGPCTQALIAAGITRVVYAMVDPNPLVAGQGLATLVAAGIQVDGPVLEQEANQLNPGFIRRMQSRGPWVRCKLAASLDGRTAMANGDSQWITGAAARGDVQRWRARHGAIITGIDTVLTDNCRLSLRADELDLANVDMLLRNPPLRVVLDSHLRITADRHILNDDAPSLVITATETVQTQTDKQNQLRALTTTLPLEGLSLAKDQGLDLSQVLRLLSDKFHCNEVLIEAGATLSGAFLMAGLIDELIIYQAPILLGSRARPLFNLPIDAMANKISLEILDKREFGPDQRIIARPKLTLTEN